MTLTAARIVKAGLASGAFPGEGAKRWGGRWNSPGVAVIYCAGSISLAMLEVFVHLQSQELMQKYVTFEVSFDEGLVTSGGRLPKNWRKSPPPAAAQQVGDEWVRSGRSAVLRLPSVIVPSEYNYLLNPAHPDFAKIKVGPKRKVEFDSRLVKSGR